MTSLVQQTTNFLSYLIVLADILAVILFIILVTPLKNRGNGKKIAEFFGDNAVLLAFLVATASVLGSLFFSQIAQFQPCLLCWWQRILLYPQAAILLVALIAKKDDVRKYCLTLSWIGAAVSAYHTYLQFGGTSLGNCDVGGVSCEHVYFVQYGYVTIPTMALTAFVLIILFLSFKKKR
jgi:disulfide bond formation protein DsbB